MSIAATTTTVVQEDVQDRLQAPSIAELHAIRVDDRVDVPSLRFPRGVSALVGGNGAGKSTVLALLAGRLVPSRGRVSILGQPARSPEAAALRADVPQRVSFPARARVAELLGLARAARGVSAEATDAAILRFGLRDLLDRPSGRLSGGERQRVALAAALMGSPPLWLLDEPAASLDREGLRELAEAVAEHAAGGGSVVVSVHRDEELVAYAPGTVVRLELGRVVEVGSG